MDRRTFLLSAGLAGLWWKSEAAMNSPISKNKKPGIALVGLGSYAMGQLAPALQKTKHVKLTALVSGSPEKLDRYAKEYNIKKSNLYLYDQFDSIADNPDVDIVYVVLPNSMHAEYTIRAAKAKKHVICEKPMAISTEECRQMMDACQQNGVTLSIGYRLHFEPYNLEMKRLGQNRVFGGLQTVKTNFSFKASPGIWRLDKQYSGGGPLMDIGIYCLQAGIYVTGQLPEYVSAYSPPTTKPDKYKNVEEEIDFVLFMPNGVEVKCRCSYEENACYLIVDAEDGKFGLEPSFYYGGIKGFTPNGPITLEEVNQQALQMDAFALSLAKQEKSIVPGEMGLRDMQIIEAIYKAMASGKKEKVDYSK